MTAKQYRTLTRKFDKGVPVTDKELNAMSEYADNAVKRLEAHGKRKRVTV